MMHHARIARIAPRAFNTPLMVEPSKALAFLSGLGPRIAGQEITFQGSDLAETGIVRAALPTHASLIGGGIAESQRNIDTQPFTLIDGIAVIEIAGTLVDELVLELHHEHEVEVHRASVGRWLHRLGLSHKKLYSPLNKYARMWRASATFGYPAASHLCQPFEKAFFY